MEACPNKLDATTWQEYRNALFRFIMQRVGNAATAEDIVQDFLIKAYAQQASLRDPSKLRPWLYQITRNTITDYYRLRKPLEAIADEFTQENAGEEENRARLELARYLVPLLETLPEPYREALKLADFEGAKQKEVASRLGLSLSGAKSRVQRTRKMLRDTLLTCCRVLVDHQGRAVDYEVGKGCDSC